MMVPEERARPRRQKKKDDAEAHLASLLGAIPSPARLPHEVHNRILGTLLSSEAGSLRTVWTIPPRVLGAAAAIAFVSMAAGAGAGIWWARTAWLKRPLEAPEISAPLPMLALLPPSGASAKQDSDQQQGQNPTAAGALAEPANANEDPGDSSAQTAVPDRSRNSSDREAAQHRVATHRAPPPPVLGGHTAPSTSAGTRVAGTPATTSTNARGSVRSPAAAASTAESANYGEWALLSAALEQIKARDYERALETLKQHETRYPHGVLENEVRLTKLSALTRSGKMNEALSILESTALSGPRMLDMLVLRGELRTHAGRYAAAAEDFGQALLGHPRADLDERALYGRAVCRANIGDGQGARRDAHEYLSKYSSERRAGEVQRILGL